MLRLLAAMSGLGLFLPGCLGVGPEPAAPQTYTSGFYEDSLEHRGQPREYRVYLPPGLSERGVRGLVIALHGGLGTPVILESQTGLAGAAAEYGFAVVYPAGVGRTFNAGRCCGVAARENIDDVGFIARLADILTRRHDIDPDRVFGTGFSNGAMMLHRIACEKPGLFAAIAPVAGARMVDVCPDAGPVAALLIQGLEDDRIPWEGGEFRGTYRPATAQMVDELAVRNGCADRRRPLPAADSVQCFARVDCRADAPLRYCGIDGVGHQWPGGDTVLRVLLGPNSDAYDASARILAFFTETE